MLCFVQLVGNPLMGLSVGRLYDEPGVYRLCRNALVSVPTIVGILRYPIKRLGGDVGLLVRCSRHQLYVDGLSLGAVRYGVAHFGDGQYFCEASLC